VFFNADGSAITPGNFLSTGGTVRQKPDITAADGVATSFPAYPASYFNPFYGTSAAAPHAAAIAALVKSYKPNLSAAQIRNILTSTALDIEAGGYDKDSGYGIVMADRALSKAQQMR
jgi:subtilisin family serine protease